MATPKKTTTSKSPAKKAAAKKSTTKKPAAKVSPAAAARKAPNKTTAARSVASSGKATPRKSVAKDPVFEGPLGSALEAVRTPVYAYVGVNDLAVEAVSGIVADLRRRAEDAVTDAQEKVTGKVADVQRHASEVPELVQSVPGDVQALLARFRTEELRKVAEAYLQVATGIYNGLAARGEDVVSRLRDENPQLEAGFQKVNESVGRAAAAIEDQVELGEEALGTVARQTRSVGVRAAGKVSKVARRGAEPTGDAADIVDEPAYAVSDQVQNGATKVESPTGVDSGAKARKSTVAKKAVPAETADKGTASKSATKKVPATKSPARKTAVEAAAATPTSRQDASATAATDTSSAPESPAATATSGTGTASASR